VKAARPQRRAASSCAAGPLGLIADEQIGGHPSPAATLCRAGNPPNRSV